jgi:hypothetical protein
MNEINLGASDLIRGRVGMELQRCGGGGGGGDLKIKRSRLVRVGATAYFLFDPLVNF